MFKELLPECLRLARREWPASHFIPYACPWDEKTILTKNGQLIQMIRLEGFAAETADSDDLTIKKALRNALLKSIAGDRFALWFHTLRQRKSSYPAGDFSPGFARYLDSRWKKRSLGNVLYENKLVVSLLRKGTGGPAEGCRNFFQSLSHRVDRNGRQAELAVACQDLTDTMRRVEAALADYGPRILKARRTPAGLLSEPLAFLSQLINLEERPVLEPEMDLSRYLPYKRHFFGFNAIECRGARASRLAAIVSIKEYGRETAAGMLDRFFHLPVEFVMSQSFVFSGRQDAISAMKRQQRLMVQTADVALSQVAEIDQALDEAMSGGVAFGEHHLTVQPMASTLGELEDAVTLIDAELTNLGILAVREDLNMEPCFWAQLPGNFDYVARRSVISTLNLAGFMSLHNEPIGKPAGNHWGPAVTVFETRSGTPYFFNFHQGDVGHTLIIGPTGTGKTVLLSFLAAQAQKFNGRLFFFDKDRGAEIFLRALGGSYAFLGGGRSAGLNPLQLPDTPSHRAFLNDWLKSLLTALGGELTSQEESRVSDCVNNTFKLRPEDRCLEKVAPFLGVAAPGSLAARLALWHSGGPRSSLFGGVEDRLALNAPVMGFEMGAVLKDPVLLGPALLYLFHRIQMILDGTPTILVLDEAWALLDNAVFASKIKDWLKTLRKLNAAVVCATQSVEDAVTSSISDTLIQQSATQIYFPNTKATEAYRQVFKLSERELQLIRETDPASRHFLLKHGRDSVVARLDLSEMKEVIPVLSGRAETVRKMDRLVAEEGEKPESWLGKFMEVPTENIYRA